VPEGATYEIAGFELGSFETILPRSSYQETNREVKITEKSVLKQKKISLLQVTMESDAGDYRGSVFFRRYPDRIELRNENNHPVRKYGVKVDKITDLAALRKDPRIYDVYPSGNGWMVRVKEIPAKRLSYPGRETIPI
jgi:hypothetical protein